MTGPLESSISELSLDLAEDGDLLDAKGGLFALTPLYFSVFFSHYE